MNTIVQRWAVLGVVMLTMVVAQAETPATSAAEVKPAVVVKAQTTCPVMGGDIDKKQFVDAQGKRIYVCCGGCVGEVKKDPAKYITKLEAAGITLDKTPSEPPATEKAEKHGVDHQH